MPIDAKHPKIPSESERIREVLKENGYSDKIIDKVVNCEDKESLKKCLTKYNIPTKLLKDINKQKQKERSTRSVSAGQKQSQEQTVNIYLDERMKKKPPAKRKAPSSQINPNTVLIAKAISGIQPQPYRGYASDLFVNKGNINEQITQKSKLDELLFRATQAKLLGLNVNEVIARQLNSQREQGSTAGSYATQGGVQGSTAGIQGSTAGSYATQGGIQGSTAGVQSENPSYAPRMFGSVPSSAYSSHPFYSLPEGPPSLYPNIGGYPFVDTNSTIPSNPYASSEDEIVSRRRLITASEAFDSGPFTGSEAFGPTSYPFSQASSNLEPYRQFGTTSVNQNLASTLPPSIASQSSGGYSVYEGFPQVSPTPQLASTVPPSIASTVPPSIASQSSGGYASTRPPSGAYTSYIPPLYQSEDYNYGGYGTPSFVEDMSKLIFDNSQDSVADSGYGGALELASQQSLNTQITGGEPQSTAGELQSTAGEPVKKEPDVPSSTASGASGASGGGLASEAPDATAPVKDKGKTGPKGPRSQHLYINSFETYEDFDKDIMKPENQAEYDKLKKYYDKKIDKTIESKHSLTFSDYLPFVFLYRDKPNYTNQALKALIAKFEGAE